ncbi:MAG: cation transporter [Planctomycetes bacterium]|nr:cation transporter [Planctomycetota bacterium]
MAELLRAQQLLTRLTLAFSVLLVGVLYAAFWLFNSQLALAQAADSFMDVFTTSVLAWAVTVAAQPEDKEHPFGHSRAEPIGALIAAVVAGVLAIEVGRSAITALVEGSTMQADWVLVAAFGAKSAIKTVVFFFARALARRKRSPAMEALGVDARNDVLVSLLALAGFLGSRYGWPMLDAWLALPVAVWIGFAGVRLARDNIKLLMGEAPPPERQQELLALAAAVPGVRDAHDLRAHFLGTRLQLEMHIVVDPALTVLQAHDIGEAVKAALQREPDVGHCSVHIDIQ